MDDDSDDRRDSAAEDSRSNEKQPDSAGPSSSSGTATGPGSGAGGNGGSGSASAVDREAVANAAASQLSKRRRGLGVVTPNACTECRKKRAKCDGGKPCGRCRAQKDIECVYEVPVRQSKENLRTEIDTLRRQQRQSDSVFSALVRPELWEEVLKRLQGGQTIENISEWLGGTLPSGGGALPNFPRQGDPNQGGQAGSGAPGQPGMANFAGPNSGAYNVGVNPPQGQGRPQQDYGSNSPWHFSNQSQTVSTRSDSHPDIMQWTTEGSRSRVGSWVQSQSDTAQYRGLDQVLATSESQESRLPSATWTNVTSDSVLVQHLLALYFCWEYPTFASLSKEHFLKDFLDVRPRYCSPLLVNALLALGCRFSRQPNTRANPDDPYTSGDHFFKEALRLFNREQSHHHLTTIQALGIMSIREASCGRDSESWYYAGQSIRLAVEMGLHRLHDDGDEDETAVQAATFWGAFALDHAWSLATGSLPQCSCFPHLPPKPAIIGDIEASLWIPYSDDGAPMQRSCEQPSNVRSVYKCFCELSELVHQSLYILHSPGRPLASRDLLSIYTQYLNWYDRIPEVLRLGQNFTPSVLFAHMYYHFAILLLFRPLIKLRIIGSSILPRDVCAQAADAIQGLLRSYSQLYTLRRTPSFVPYFVLTSAIMHLAVGANATAEHSRSIDNMSNPSTVKMEDADHEPDSSTTAAHEQTDRLATVAQNANDVTSPTGSSNTASTSKLHPRVAEAFKQGIADLTEMAPCHHFAEQALNILRFLAKKWNIQVDIPPQEGLTDEERDRLTRPNTSSLNFFAPNVVNDDFVCAWDTRSVIRSVAEMASGAKPSSRRPKGDAAASVLSDEGEGMEGVEQENRQPEGFPGAPPLSKGNNKDKGKGMLETLEDQLGGPMSHAAKSIDNPLFWPFPMQGRPMLPSGKLLEEAGFALL